MMCRMFKVARSGFYQWLHKPLSDRAIEDERLLALIKASYDASGGVYGAPRLMAVVRRRPKGNVIVHSDQGTQYGSDDWMRFCQSNSLTPSMSRRGNCWDNAVAESFFSSLKKERVKKRVYKTRDLARADIFDYIESFYDRNRRHSHIGGVSPEAYEAASF